MMSFAEFSGKLRPYGRMKLDHARKRMIFLRKPLAIMRRPVAWLRRRRPKEPNRLAPELKPLQMELERAGFARADGVLDNARLCELQDLVDGRIDGIRNAHTTQLSGRKDFWQAILTADDLRESSPLVAHALTPAVVDIVTAYLGEVPFLSRLELVVSRPTEGPWKVSQLWHRDYNDRRMVKLFTYLSDVQTEAQGPFTYLPANAIERRGPLFPIHKNDSQMERFSRLEDKSQVLGPTGTSFLIDTHRCFHCGSRILDGSFRVAFIATYTTSTPYYDYDNEISLEGPGDAANRMLLRA